MTIADDIARHLDKEMSWMVSEMTAELFRTNEVVKRGQLCEAVGRLVGEIMIERLGPLEDGLLPFTVDEFGQLGLDSIKGMDEAIMSGKSDRASYHVAQACVAFACVRTMGMKSPYTQRHVPGNDYWPFGQEGGFCNPMKLKSMD